MSQETNCSNFESRINELLDLRLDLDSDHGLSSHAAKCQDCNKTYDDYLALDDSLNNVIWDVATLARLTTPTIASYTRNAWLVGSLAAALLVGTSLVYGLFQTENENSSNLTYLTAPELLPVQSAKTTSPDATFESASHLGQAESKPIPAKETQTVSWEEISERLLPLSSYYQISAELPGVRPFQSSLSVTIDWVQQTIQKLSFSPSQEPGFGRVIQRAEIPVA